MCSGAIQLYGITKVVIGDNKTFQSPESHLRAEGVEIDIRQNPECIAMMEDFIKTKPEL
jgi:cytosine deaminase